MRPFRDRYVGSYLLTASQNIAQPESRNRVNIIQNKRISTLENVLCGLQTTTCVIDIDSNVIEDFVVLWMVRLPLYYVVYSGERVSRDNIIGREVVSCASFVFILFRHVILEYRHNGTPPLTNSKRVVCI